jgi:hypothetical protein
MNTSEEQKKPGPPKKPPIREEDIQGFKYLDSFFKTLTRLHDVKDHQNRELHYDQYLALLLLYFLPPSSLACGESNRLLHWKKSRNGLVLRRQALVPFPKRLRSLTPNC